MLKLTHDSHFCPFPVDQFRNPGKQRTGQDRQEKLVSPGWDANRAAAFLADVFERVPDDPLFIQPKEARHFLEFLFVHPLGAVKPGTYKAGAQGLNLDPILPDIALEAL